MNTTKNQCLSVVILERNERLMTALMVLLPVRSSGGVRTRVTPCYRRPTLDHRRGR